MLQYEISSSHHKFLVKITHDVSKLCTMQAYDILYKINFYKSFPKTKIYLYFIFKTFDYNSLTVNTHDGAENG